MQARTPVLVFAAHPDDWQIFAGAAIFEHLRDPQSYVAFVNLTAGDAGDDPYHWKSRHSGAVMSVLRGLSSWSPFAMDAAVALEMPSGFGVAYDRLVIEQKTVLRTTIAEDGCPKATVYSLHLPDGKPDGSGFGPAYESLEKLRSGRDTLTTVWPEDGSTQYRTWDELLSVLGALTVRACNGFDGAVRMYAPDPDPRENPGDHSDHRATGGAARDLMAEHSFLEPVWMSMYDVGNRPENLNVESAHRQRAAIVAYGGGYSSSAAGMREDWRRGWEREAETFKNRQYLRFENGRSRKSS